MTTTLELMLAKADGHLYTWLEQPPTTVQADLLDVAREQFRPVRELTIEDAVQARPPGASQMSPTERKTALLQMARPAWNLDETRLPHGGAHLARLVLLGVPDADDTVYRADGDQLVSTSDPHRITAFSMTAGVPMGALRKYDVYAARYDAARRADSGVMLHVLPGMELGAERASLALALGLVFEFVVDRQANYYYRPTDPLADDVWLGRGTRRALQQLADEPARLSELHTRIEEHIEQIGLKDAYEQMMTFCTPSDGDDDLRRDLKRQVRDYARTLEARV